MQVTHVPMLFVIATEVLHVCQIIVVVVVLCSMIQMEINCLVKVRSVQYLPKVPGTLSRNYEEL